MGVDGADARQLLYLLDTAVHILPFCKLKENSYALYFIKPRELFLYPPQCTHSSINVLKPSTFFCHNYSIPGMKFLSVKAAR